MLSFSEILSQILTGLESYGISAFDFDLLTCLGIPAFAGFPVDLFECTKTEKCHLAAACFQPSFYSVQK